MILAIEGRNVIHKILVVLILLLAFLLRIDDVGNWQVRWDEAFSVWESQMGFFELSAYTAGDVHPPLYYWVLHVWMRLTGTSEFAVRALSVFFGLLSTVFVYSITLQFSKRKLIAALAILLIALSPFHIRWSQDARMYAIATMFTGMAVYAYWRGWARLLVIGGIGTVLSHYFGAIVLGIIILHRLLHWREIRHGRRQWISAIAFIVAVCMLWGVYAVGLMRKDPGFATFDPQMTFKLMSTMFAVGDSHYMYTHFPYILVIATVFFIGLALNWHENRRATTLIVLGSILPPVAISIFSLPFIPVHVNSLQERYFIIFAPFVFAGYGIGLAAIMRRQRLVGMVMCAGLLILNTVVVAAKRDEKYLQDYYRSMMATVAAFTGANDKVFFTSGGRKPVVYFYLDRVGYDVPKNAYAEPINVTGIPRNSNDVSSMMEWVFASADRFWLIEIEAHLDEPLDARTNWINKNYHRIYHIPVGWNGISFYSKNINDTIPELDLIIPPVVTEARPGDQIRIGVPAGTKVDLFHSGQIIDTHVAETWMLHQIDIYPFYFNGYYELRVADESYPFVITHSQDFPGSGA